MATGASGDGFIRGFFDGCISNPDSGINRRPYHKNCTCALHKSRGHCSHTTTGSNNVVSYPIRRTWSEGSFTLIMSSPGSSSPPPLLTVDKAYLFPYNEE